MCENASPILQFRCLINSVAIQILRTGLTRGVYSPSNCSSINPETLLATLSHSQTPRWERADAQAFWKWNSRCPNLYFMTCLLSYIIPSTPCLINCLRLSNGDHKQALNFAYIKVFVPAKSPTVWNKDNH